ncbi:nuclear pore complex subunit [Purpureocillium lavendulum]|uniref:Nuclear pore complex subunit n=1 Tax=Purpureocillium lavendulum TaxID=1247861 RepID=A0AB34G5Y9_9HYPO|nr:nuclear pore complex subunit [Purpureocillium lavendulum]
MAFGFSSNAGNPVGGGGGAGGANKGPDLETIQTEALGFLSVAGDAKVRLTSSWSSSLPAATSSLLSIASRKGLVAAVGPDQLVIASTESVRKAFESPKDGDSDIRGFEPQLRVPMSMRIAQVAFTADEKYLILSAESGGGLAVYEVQSLLQGSASTSFELSTNGESLRSLIPNPTTEKAELCAIVTTNGNLHMADLNDRRLSNALIGQVSCVSWSTKGKQLCAGLADGTIHQMKPTGEATAEIPRPPGLDNCHVSSLTWLENNLFLSIHTTTNASPPSSAYHIITRQPQGPTTFQKLADPVEPFGSDKVPHHSILRLKDFEPDLQDLLLVSSTASTEIGLLSRSKVPLATDKPADAITGVFTTTELLDDTKRPTLPMTDPMDDSTPVGIAIDLSSKDKVYKPIPADEELEESPGPLPGLWVLTHEGVLCSWWVVYTDSIKRGTTYSGFAALEGAPAATTPRQPAPAAQAAPFGSPGGSAFGSSAAAAQPAFGASSQLGQSSSPWATSAPKTPSATGGATFGSSTFGTTPAGGPAFGKPSAVGFGQASQVGMRTSPWGGSSGSGPAFGQSGFSSFAKGGSNQSPFGSAAPAAPSGGGFSGFSKRPGFASVAESSGGSSIFGEKKPTSNPFATSSANADTAFPAKDSKPSGGLFGSTPFKLESSFKADPSQSESNEKPAAPSGTSMFGNAFGSALNDANSQPRSTTPPAKDEDMDAEQTEQTPQAAPPKSIFSPSTEESTTPKTTPVPSRFGFTTSSAPTPGTSLFGQPTKLPSQSSGFTGFFSQTKSKPAAVPETPKIKVEEQDEPLPPDTTSKATYPLGESSSSSAASNAANKSFESTPPARIDDAPLPPDFTTTPKAGNLSTEAPLPPDFTKPVAQAPSEPAVVDEVPLPPDFAKPSKPAVADEAPLPPDFVLPAAPSKEASAIPSVPEVEGDESDLGEDNASEGSGVDVAKDLSPTTSGLSPTPGFTPQSSFGGVGGQAPPTSWTDQQRPKPLFGEISRNAPLFPRPSAASPRSPSPVRGAVPQRVMRSDSTRSVSAPGMASQILGPKKPDSQLGASIVSRERLANAEDQFLIQHRKLKEKQEAEEAQPLVDEEDDEMQKVLSSEVEGTLELDEFIAHSNVAPPAKDSIPSQVEAVYRDINSMIDTLGLNARAVKAFTKGHTEGRKEDGRSKDDLEDPDDWVLCEVSELGEVLDRELHNDLEDGRVQDLDRDDKLDVCQDLARDMQRLRAKQEDLKRVIMTRLDPDQVEIAKTLPLSAEQAAQQNDLRREFANFTKSLNQVEEALTILKTKIASASSSAGRGGANVPTVEAVIRTINRMTTMAEKRSGDIDVLETQLRKMRLGSTSREGSPMVTPQARRSIMLSPESTPSRNLRQSFSGSVMSFGATARATPPRRKVSGFSREEKGELMAKKSRRQAVLDKFKESVEKKGVSVWNMEDIE